MKFKNFIEEQKTPNINEYVDIEEMVNEMILEANNISAKLKGLNRISNKINKLDILEIFTEIKAFLKTTLLHMKISDIKNWGLEIIRELEYNVKALLDIKNTLNTSYVDSLIVQSSKLIKTIEDHIAVRKDEYNSLKR
jgi:hypothetical protein